MNITIKKSLHVTASLETYIEKKFTPLAKFVKAFDQDGLVELYVEVSRTSKHHQKGEEVFMTCADLRLPGKILRAEASASDIRKAIDEARDTLQMEIEKYKTKRTSVPRASREEK
jgi:ribosomal subunit interface protein